jgi:hypothetical protein
MRLFDYVFTVSLFLFLAIIVGSPCTAQEQPIKNLQTSDEGTVYFIRNDSIWIFDLKTAQERQITQGKK